MEINYELYKVFYTVAKEMSFSKAAQTLYISQSAVSQSIRQLEHKLGTSLFVRTTKQVSLTQDGKNLLAHVEPAVNMFESGELQLQEAKALERGRLHIAASDTLCRYYLLDYFRRFHDKYPAIEIKVTNRTSVRCVELLHQGNVDLIVTNLPNGHLTKDMVATETYSFQDIFVANPKFFSHEKPWRLDSLAQKPILMLTRQTTTSEFLFSLFEKENLTITPSIELGSIDLLVDMARIGLGLTFVPDFCVRETSDLEVLEIDFHVPMRHIGVVTHNRRPLSRSAEAFMSLLITSDIPIGLKDE